MTRPARECMGLSSGKIINSFNIKWLNRRQTICFILVCLLLYKVLVYV